MQETRTPTSTARSEQGGAANLAREAKRESRREESQLRVTGIGVEPPAAAPVAVRNVAGGGAPAWGWSGAGYPC